MIEKILTNRFSILYLLPFLLGSSTVLSFAPFNFTIINFIVFPLFFYLINFINKKSKSVYRIKPHRKNLFIFGTFFGFGFYFSGLHWIVNSLTFDENFKILIPFGLIFIPLFLSLFISLTVIIIGPYLKLNMPSIFLFSSSFALSDYIRAKILTGFPWNLWAYSFSWATEFLQVLNHIGLFAFNLIIITIFMIPSVFFFNINFKKKISIILLSSLMIFLVSIYGNFSLNKNDQKIKLVDKKFYVKVISPNFKLGYNFTKSEMEERLKKMLRYSNPDKTKKTLFVWPEGIFSGYSYYEILQFKEIFLNNFTKNHLIVFGINRYSMNKKGFYNSLIIVNRKLEIIEEYKKQKLVPFGEFLPFEKWLRKFGLKKVTEGHGSFLKAEKQDNLVVGDLNILPLICYEIIFPQLTQSAKQTNLIINISEDGWFGKSIGPSQHFAKAIFRAIEHNSFLIRSANQGVTAIVDNKGKLIKKLNPSETGNIELEVPLIQNQNRNKNDLIFFILLITYIFIFNLNKKNDYR